MVMIAVLFLSTGLEPISSDRSIGKYDRRECMFSRINIQLAVNDRNGLGISDHVR